MLLLHRHQNESVVIHKDNEFEQPIVVRVTEVLPTGDVTLAFKGDGYTVVRQEILGTSPRAKKYKHKEKDDENESRRTYYS